MAKAVMPIQTEHSKEWHWKMFADFCAKKAEVKEPSPHLQMIGSLTKDKPIEEVIWFSCLYAAFYNLPSALVMWKEWPWIEAVANPEKIEPWLKENWAGTFTRIERRAVRTVPNMNACIVSLIQWADTKVPDYIAGLEYLPEDYDYMWKESENDLAFMGRYIIIRLLEALHRYAGLKPKLYDIRSIGGWSPKKALGLLYPEHLDLLLSNDTKENVIKVDAIAMDAIRIFDEEHGVPMSEYVFAAMLCEYRVAYENKKQYPGWTIDQEPAYWYRIRGFWLEHRGPEFVQEIEEQFFGSRKATFAVENLGEIQGWDGTRIQPRSVLREIGYNWSDLLYDYNATVDYMNPVRR